MPAELAAQRPLLERAATGDRESFARLYDTQVDGVYRYLLAGTGNRLDAAELTSGGSGGPPECGGRPCPAPTTVAVAAGGGSTLGTPLPTGVESSTTTSTVAGDADAVVPPPAAPRTSDATVPPSTRPVTTAPPTTEPRPTTTTVPTTTAPPTTAAPTTTTVAPAPT